MEHTIAQNKALCFGGRAPLFSQRDLFRLCLLYTSGFCFGVNRAVELTYNLLNEGDKLATLGPLIHNPQAVADMERRGALVADTVDDIPTGYEVIIRSHGVPRTIYDTLEQPYPESPLPWR